MMSNIPWRFCLAGGCARVCCSCLMVPCFLYVVCLKSSVNGT
jgi:hypothetical protein